MLKIQTIKKLSRKVTSLNRLPPASRPKLRQVLSLLSICDASRGMNYVLKLTQLN